MKKEHPEIAVIISSAKEDIQTRVSMLRSGADDYITKPFDTEELLARLEAVLRRSGKSIASWNQENNKEPLEEENRRKLQYKDILMEPEERHHHLLRDLEYLNLDQMKLPVVSPFMKK